MHHVFSLCCIFTSRHLVMVPNTVGSMFTSLPAAGCFIAPHDHSSWPLTPSHVWPPLAITVYHSLRFICLSGLKPHLAPLTYPCRDPTENTTSNSSSVVVFVYVEVVAWFACHGNVFTEQLPSNGRLLWFCSSGFERTCPNIKWSLQKRKIQVSMYYAIWQYIQLRGKSRKMHFVQFCKTIWV
jgi:hypothetical protein